METRGEGTRKRGNGSDTLQLRRTSATETDPDPV